MGLETLALVSAGTSLVSGAAGAVGSFQQAEAQEAQSAFRAAVARNNAVRAEANAETAARRAEIAQENAERAGFAGQQRARRQDRDAAREIGATRAAQGASGLRGGSQQSQVSFLRQLAAEDRENIRRQGDARASQFRARSQDFTTERFNQLNQAEGLRSQADATEAFSEFSANTTRIGGIASAVEGAGNAASSVIGSGAFGSASEGPLFPSSPLGRATDPAVRRLNFGSSPTTRLSF